jgi:hypothetical protein
MSNYGKLMMPISKNPNKNWRLNLKRINTEIFVGKIIKLGYIGIKYVCCVHLKKTFKVVGFIGE